MAIFSKTKSPKAAPKDAAPAEPAGPVQRPIYVPKYAVRDAMQCTPSGQKPEQREALRRAHEERSIREEYEKTMQQYALSNPKMSISRNSSAPSTPYAEGSRAASTRFASPFASSVTSLPSLIHHSPPALAVPAYHASASSSAGPSTPSLSRSSSYLTRPHIQSLEAHLAVPGAGRFSSSSLSSMPQVAMSKKAFGETPWESPEETVDVPHSAGHSSRSSSADETDALEMAPRFDSTQSSPVIPDSERFYPNDPRKLGKAPVMTALEVSELPKPPKKYFSHPARPATAHAAPVAAAPEKKRRFSLIRRSQAVSAH